MEIKNFNTISHFQNDNFINKKKSFDIYYENDKLIEKEIKNVNDLYIKIENYIKRPKEIKNKKEKFKNISLDDKINRKNYKKEIYINNTNIKDNNLYHMDDFTQLKNRKNVNKSLDSANYKSKIYNDIFDNKKLKNDEVKSKIKVNINHMLNRFKDFQNDKAKKIEEMKKKLNEKEISNIRNKPIINQNSKNIAKKIENIDFFERMKLNKKVSDKKKKELKEKIDQEKKEEEQLIIEEMEKYNKKLVEINKHYKLKKIDLIPVRIFDIKVKEEVNKKVEERNKIQNELMASFDQKDKIVINSNKDTIISEEIKIKNINEILKIKNKNEFFITNNDNNIQNSSRDNSIKINSINTYDEFLIFANSIFGKTTHYKSKLSISNAYHKLRFVMNNLQTELKDNTNYPNFMKSTITQSIKFDEYQPNTENLKQG